MKKLILLAAIAGAIASVTACGSSDDVSDSGITTAAADSLICEGTNTDFSGDYFVTVGTGCAGELREAVFRGPTALDRQCDIAGGRSVYALRGDAASRMSALAFCTEQLETGGVSNVPTSTSPD